MCVCVPVHTTRSLGIEIFEHIVEPAGPSTRRTRTRTRTTTTITTTTITITKASTTPTPTTTTTTTTTTRTNNESYHDHNHKGIHNTNANNHNHKPQCQRENGRVAFTCLHVVFFFPLPSPLHFFFGSFLADLPFVFPLSLEDIVSQMQPQVTLGSR